ncbi:metallophosphoesterase [Shewanella aegiceratis]|uniref:metallophosphoesterase n=1 Tax=Shewanella aegiceratis TaxID=2864203 RepID=UPI001C656556|nr:metallophosphoesterase [Shewanella aegiceratis]QYJ84360.1 metallophosphoesterase [Shewanella aegiceratis]
MPLDSALKAASLCLAGLLPLQALAVQAQTQQETKAVTQASTNSGISDGPYLFLNPKAEIADWICEGEHKQTRVNQGQLSRPEHCGQLPEPSLNPQAKEVLADSYQGVDKIVALSDVHGQYEVLLQLLRRNKIIDQNDNWAFGKGHMVMTGDMFDRGPQVNEVLWFMYKLDKQAKAAGGQLHLLMGNHEQMVMRGDLRYVNDKYQTASKLLDRSYEALYGQDSELGQWLRSKHTIVKINDTLFLHGGISQEWVDRGLTLARANSLYRENIDKSKAELKQDELLNFLFFGNGPTWYRGYFKPDFDTQELANILDYFKVKRIVVGHTSQTRVLGLFDNRVIAIDSSIKKGLSGELLLIEKDQLIRGQYDGNQTPL